jgi:protein arginine kinase activator
MPGKRKCDKCKKRPATIHLTDLVRKSETHLCPECYQAQEEEGTHAAAAAKNPFAELLESLSTGKARKEKKTKICPNCGRSLEEFQELGRFGCAEDYKAFREELLPLLQKIHGATAHLGKVPSHAGPEMARRKEQRALQLALKQAIARENYLEAAHIRDQLNNLKEKEPNGPNDHAK